MEWNKSYGMWMSKKQFLRKQAEKGECCISFCGGTTNMIIITNKTMFSLHDLK